MPLGRWPGKGTQMDKRQQKRHKREVARAKNQVKLSEPDVRTPEEIKAAREKSRPAHGWRRDPNSGYSKSTGRGHAGSVGRSPSTADG